MAALITSFVGLLALVLTVLIFARVIVSWTNPRGGGNLTAFLYQATEPILAPIRRVIPPSGGLDWAPMVAILLLGILTRLFLR
jgi:YggT family protein